MFETKKNGMKIEEATKISSLPKKMERRGKRVIFLYFLLFTETVNGQFLSRLGRHFQNVCHFSILMSCQ